LCEENVINTGKLNSLEMDISEVMCEELSGLGVRASALLKGRIPSILKGRNIFLF
jgi:hypothetical protein